jgi:uncharacterized delta-60 repeat protein
MARLDTRFGKNGITTTSVFKYFETIESLAIQPDGRIVVGGYIVDEPRSSGNGTDYFVARYNANGRLDTRFGKGGITRLGEEDVFASDEIQDIALQPDGKIVAVGSTFRSPTSIDFAVLRFLPNGSLDKKFGKRGIVTTDFNTTVDSASSVEIQPDGRILVVGTTNISDYSFGLTRYNQNGSLDTTFGENGKFVIGFNRGSSYAGSAALQPDGKLVIVGESNSRIGVVRYDTKLPAVACEKAEIKDVAFSGDKSTLFILVERRELAPMLFLNGKEEKAFFTGQPGAPMLTCKPNENLTGNITVQIKSSCGVKSDEFIISR